MTFNVFGGTLNLAQLNLRPTRAISRSCSFGELNDTPTCSRRSSRGCRAVGVVECGLEQQQVLLKGDDIPTANARRAVVGTAGWRVRNS